MTPIGPNPSSDELKALAGVFADTEAAVQDYLSTPEGQADLDFNKLTTAAIRLNNAADTIAVMQLRLAVDRAAEAVGAINQAAAELQKAIDTRAKITHDLAIVQSVVAFGAAIAAGDVGSIISSGSDLHTKLTT